MSFQAKIIGATGLKIIYDLEQGLEKTGRNSDWGLGINSIFSAIPRRYEIVAALIDENGKTIGSATRGFEIIERYDSNRLDFSYKDATLTFSNVDANKITDKMTVSIVSVNGMDAKIAGERGYISISAEDFDVACYLHRGMGRFPTTGLPALPCQQMCN
jgi:hypothetical protein